MPLPEDVGALRASCLAEMSEETDASLECRWLEGLGVLTGGEAVPGSTGKASIHCAVLFHAVAMDTGVVPK